MISMTVVETLHRHSDLLLSTKNTMVSRSAPSLFKESSLRTIMKPAVEDDDATENTSSDSLFFSLDLSGSYIFSSSSSPGVTSTLDVDDTPLPPGTVDVDAPPAIVAAKQVSCVPETLVTNAVNDQRKSSKVQFGTIQIHEHVVEPAVGSIPRIGAPLSLSNERQAEYLVNVDDYEEQRPHPPRKGQALLRSKKNRIDVLLNLGYTMRQIGEVTNECDRIRKQRTESAKKSRLSLSALSGVFQSILSNHQKRNGKMHVKKNSTNTILVD